MEPLGYVEDHMIGHLAYTRVPRGLTIKTVHPLAPGQWDVLSPQAQRCVVNPKGHRSWICGRLLNQIRLSIYQWHTIGLRTTHSISSGPCVGK